MLNYFDGFPKQLRENFKNDLCAGIMAGVLLGGVNNFVLVQARRLGATPFEIAFLTACPFIWLLFSPLWERIWGRQSPYKMVFIFDGLARLSLILLLLNFSRNWYIFLFTIYYLLSSISATVYGRAMCLAYTPQVRGTLMGWVRVGLSLASVVSLFLAGQLLPLWGVQRYFACLALFGLASAWFFRQIKPLNSEEKVIVNPRSLSIFEILKTDRLYRQYMMALFVFGISNLMSIPIFTIYQVDTLKITDGFISMVALVTSASALGFYLIGGRLIDQGTPVKLLINFFALAALIPVIYLIMGGQNGFLFLSAIILGMVNAVTDLASLNSVLYFAKEDEKVGSYMAVHMNLLGLRGTIGPLLIPFLINWLTVRGVFILLMFLYLVAWYLGKQLVKDVNLENQTKVKVELGG